MKLGIDLFSLRLQNWNAFELMDYAHQLGVQVVHFSEPRFLGSLAKNHLQKVKSRAAELKLAIEVGMGSICPTSGMFSAQQGTAVEQVTQMLHVAKLLGSPILRCYLGSNADRRGELPLEAHMEATVKTCRAVRELTLELGLKLAIENHAGDMQGRELKMLIEEAGPDYVGACLDTGNPLWVAESPFVTLEHLAPYVVACHIRDTAVWEHPRGAAVQWVALGDGTIGMKDWAKLFQEKCPGIPFTLEIISGAPAQVLNYLESDYWSAYPEARAGEFAQFLRLVKSGTPPLTPMLTAPWSGNPPEYEAALALQQRLDLERSLQYCRQEVVSGN